MATRKQRVVLDTASNRIVGDLLLPEESYRSRLSDLLNRQGLAFVSLTDAEITPRDGRSPEAHAFLAVAKEHVQIAFELDA